MTDEGRKQTEMSGRWGKGDSGCRLIFQKFGFKGEERIRVVAARSFRVKGVCVCVCVCREI